MKKYIVRLSKQESQTLRRFISSGKRSAQLFTRTRILLKADQGEMSLDGQMKKLARLSM